MKDIGLLVTLMRQRPLGYVLGFVFMALGTGAFLMVPFQIGELFRAINAMSHSSFLNSVAGQEQEPITPVLYPLISMTVFLALGSAFALAQSLCITVTSERIMNTLRFRYFQKVITRHLDESDPKPSGDMASEFFSDLAIIHTGIAKRMLDTARNALFAIGACVAMFVISPDMTGIAVLGIAVLAGAIVLIARYIRRSVVGVQAARSAIMNRLLEGATNAFVIRAYGQEAFMERRFEATLNDVFRRILRHNILLSSVPPISSIAFVAVLFVMLIYGMMKIQSGVLEAPSLITYFTFAIALAAGGGNLSLGIGDLNQSAAVAAKHRDTLETVLRKTPPLPRRTVAQEPLEAVTDDLRFTYRGADSEVLRGISVQFAAGEITAVTGETGCGKSSLAALICGLFEPTAGTVTIGGKTSGHGAPETLRSQIAIVPQEPFLFAGSVADNIAFGREDITPADIKRAAAATGMETMLEKTEYGAPAIVAEGGGNLSRGQRQRIAIARAIAGKPGLLILDEATASLDPFSERIVTSLIKTLTGKVTVILIAHKGSILEAATRTYHMEHGQITETDGPPLAAPENRDLMP